MPRTTSGPFLRPRSFLLPLLPWLLAEWEKRRQRNQRSPWGLSCTWAVGDPTETHQKLVENCKHVWWFFYVFFWKKIRLGIRNSEWLFFALCFYMPWDLELVSFDWAWKAGQGFKRIESFTGDGIALREILILYNLGKWQATKRENTKNKNKNKIIIIVEEIFANI